GPVRSPGNPVDTGVSPTIVPAFRRGGDPSPPGARPKQVIGIARISQRPREWVKTMFAVIKTGGKQYKVAKDDVIEVEKIDLEAGKAVELGDVLMLSDGGKVDVGAPFLAGAKVSAEVVEQTR